MGRAPLLAGSRVVLVPVADDDVVLRPPPPPDTTVDVAGAVRDALRYPLAGAALEELAPRGGRATVVVEPAALPIPGAPQAARQTAIAVAIEELERHGVPDERQTILVAGGLGRRFGQNDLERLLSPPRARAFHGRVVVHDAEDPSLVELVDGIRVSRELIDADIVVSVTAAEALLHGGPAALLSASYAGTVRRLAGVDSLLEAPGSLAWELGRRVEDALAERVAIMGVSLTLDHPRLTGRYRGYPSSDAGVERVARSPLRALFSLLPDAVRRDLLRTRGRTLEAVAAFAGRPSEAHAEALLRGVARRGVRLDEPVDALVVGIPWSGPHMPREAVNPLTAATVALGLVLRLRRGEFPIRQGGTLVLLHPLTRTFEPGTQAPYAAMFNALRASESADELAVVERVTSRDDSALEEYRTGRTCHPLLPYADWAACGPALSRLGRVVVAGCRDAAAARA